MSCGNYEANTCCDPPGFPQGVLIDMLAELSGDVEHSCGKVFG